MKIKQVKSSDIASGVSQVAGVTVGLMLPGAIGNAYAKVSDDASATDDQNKKKLIVSGAALALGLYGALAITGTDTTTEFVKSLAIGVAGGGAKGLASHFLKDTVAKTDAQTVTGRMMRGALNCPAERMPAYRLSIPRSLRMPMPATVLPTAERETAYNSFNFN